ncbi:hypothetical protein BDP55DRAFT_646532 [Colletotrichum godetiae]|uniref:Uncharacterized protein n=1 Tax=Colletotrichum godetiae TaxID=1209918 RepID=A0AAJ0AVT4_9PEZI|nr:uncharacterized protein BDP55DRAFT_646532 [Colletotrichum godetiae]KAK1691274.1 hypothetical protein BDP55DRAFT_646532 [Colletotrichum godetiae]
MMSRVQAAETNAAGYRQRMEQMQHERDSESAKTREELGKYQAAIHGFSKLQEKHESLRQSFAACEQSLTTQEENFRSEAQKLQKELDRLRSSSRDAEMRRQVAMDNAAKAKRRLQTAEEDVAKMQAEITLLQQQPRDSEQRFERQSIQSSGRDDGSHKEGTDFLGMNAGRLGISNTLASLNDINMAKGAKKLKNMGNNVKANMADMLPKKMGGS